jgi:hypothetical protein
LAILQVAAREHNFSTFRNSLRSNHVEIHGSSRWIMQTTREFSDDH